MMKINSLYSVPQTRCWKFKGTHKSQGKTMCANLREKQCTNWLACLKYRWKWQQGKRRQLFVACLTVDIAVSYPGWSSHYTWKGLNQLLKLDLGKTAKAVNDPVRHSQILQLRCHPPSQMMPTGCYRSMTRESFWILLSKKSPCLIVAW